MPKDRSDFLQELRQAFAQEAQEHLQTMTSGLLALEKAGSGSEDDTVLEEVYRAAHSMKGAARAVNEYEVEALAHAMEDVFTALRKGKITLGPEGYDELQRSLSLLESMLASPEDMDPAAFRTMRQTLQDMANPENGKTARQPGAAAPKPTEAKRTEQTERDRETASKKEPPTPSPQKTEPRTAKSEEAESEENAPPAPPDQPRKKASGRGKTEETVRVEVSKLDSFLLKAESMLSAKLTLEQRLAEVRDLVSSLGGVRKKLAASKTADASGGEAHWRSTALSGLDQATAGLTALGSRMRADLLSQAGLIQDLLEQAKYALMFPFSTAALSFPKMIRDLAREQGKEAELVITGGETQIDKRILEGLKAPLTHMLRNAVDHGLETPEKRRAAGKPPQGVVRITVSETDGDKVEVLVADDGAGFGMEQLRKAAMDVLGMSREEADTCTEEDLIGLAFCSGVSSSAIITDISGRGLGLAIVREAVENLGGETSLQTAQGRGTTVRLLLPLTLATFRGILVRAAGRIFVIPTAGVSRVVLVRDADIRSAEGRDILSLEDTPHSLVRLDDALQLERPDAEQEADHGAKPALLLGSGERRLAMMVDEVVGEQDVLVKGLGKHLTGLRNISGATVLGTGAVVPVLNTMHLMEFSTPESRTFRNPQKGDEGKERTRTVLVVEDSVTSRTLLKNILQSTGYKVLTAVDGVDGLTVLRSEQVDLAVLDVDMPRMTGFELTAAIREDKKLAELPVVLVTARSSKQDRERGMELGANAYLIKSSFDQGNLLEVVQRFI